MNWSYFVCVLCIILSSNVRGQTIDTLESSAKGKNWLLIKWSVSGKPVYMYTLAYNEVNNPNVEIVRPAREDLNYRLTGLKPGTEYNIELTAFSLMSQGSKKSITAKTCGGPLNSIADITVTDITHESLSIAWDGPKSDYRTKLWTPNGMEKTVNVSGKTSSTFDKLEHTKPYYVLIDEQKPQDDCSIDAVMAGLFYVHAKSRVSEVMSLSVEALGPDSVLVQWKGLDLAKTPFVYGFNYQIREKSGKFSKSGSLPANAMSLTIGGLDAVTEYEVSITTVGIYSRRSSMGSITTSPGLPSAPQDLTTSLTGTTLTVDWKAPASVPGQLSKYRVALYKNGNIQELKETGALTATFENVDRSMYYTVKVAAFVESVDGHGGGYGPEVSSGLVIQQPPTPPPLGTPELKSVEAAGSTAVKAVWTEVPQAYGYIFTLASSTKPTIVVVVSSSPTFAILKGLEPGTKYQVTVQAMSIDKTGEKSKAIEVETLEASRMMDPTIQGKKAPGKEEGAESLPSFKKSEAIVSRTAGDDIKRGAKLAKREAPASTHPQLVAFGGDVFKVPSVDQNDCGLFNATCTKNASSPTSNQRNLSKVRATQKLEVPSKGGGGGARTIMAVAACVVAAVVLVGLATLTVMRQRPRHRFHATQPLPV